MKRLGRRGRRTALARLRDPQCALCALHKTEGNVCVLGRGNVTGRVFIIGEAPGEAEAEHGKPFMGRAGQLLNQILDELDLTHEVYITNMVRCRPPDNRNPKGSELDACSHFLREELSIVRSKIIVLLGRVAQKNMGFSREPRGKPFYHHQKRSYSAFVMPTIHPAYCLYTGRSQVKILTKHLRWVRKQLDAWDGGKPNAYLHKSS